MFQRRYPLLLLLLVLPLTFCCDDTQFSDGDQQYDVNRLTTHAAPQQTYQDTANYYARTLSGLKIVFNVMDTVKKQILDLGAGDKLEVPANCNENNGEYAACRYEPTQKSWTAIGSCVGVTKTYNSELNSVQILYGEGTNAADNFSIEIICCDTCIHELNTPMIVSSGEDCPHNTTHCVSIFSPYGCSCEEREKLSKENKNKLLHCMDKVGGGTSTGTILVILFFVIIAVYFGGGMIYNYAQEGRRGAEMIPHLEMWRDLAALIHDGFRYVISCGEYRDGVQYDTIG